MAEPTLQQNTLFQRCSDSFIKEIRARAQKQHHSKGKVLFVHGDQAERFYFIKSGWVKIFRETPAGTQVVVDIFSAGQIFGETAIFEDSIYPYSAEVVEKGDVVSLPLSNLKLEMESNNKFALDMLACMARYRRKQDTEIEHRSTQNAAQRIGCFLLHLADPSETGSVKIHLPYDKTLVAARLGMQPETFSRALAKLRDKTGIHIKGADIEMDSLNQLIGYVCVACSSEFPCKDLKAAQ